MLEHCFASHSLKCFLRHEHGGITDKWVHSSPVGGPPVVIISSLLTGRPPPYRKSLTVHCKSWCLHQLVTPSSLVFCLWPESVPRCKVLKEVTMSSFFLLQAQPWSSAFGADCYLLLTWFTMFGTPLGSSSDRNLSKCCINTLFLNLISKNTQYRWRFNTVNAKVMLYCTPWNLFFFVFRGTDLHPIKTIHKGVK